MNPKNVAFHEFKAHDFPFKIEWLNTAGETVHEATVEGPGVLPIPPLGKAHGPVSVRMTFPGGRVITEGPPS